MYPSCYTHGKAGCSLWYHMGTLIVLRYGEHTTARAQSQQLEPANQRTSACGRSTTACCSVRLRVISNAPQA
jgi:hypothetical protein